MKNIARLICIALSLLLLQACIYQAQIYSPDRITLADHPQRGQIYIYRDNLYGEIWTQENADSMYVFFDITMVKEPARFLNDEFYLKCGSKILKKSAPVKILEKIGDPGSISNLEIKKGALFLVEFPIDIKNYDSFSIYLPPIVVNENQPVPNLNQVNYRKITVWRGFAIN